MVRNRAFAKAIMRYLIRISIYLLMDLLYVIYIFVPKDRKLWIFGSQFGQAFVGNSKYLFKYISKNKKHIKAIWLSRNKSILRDLKKSGFEAYSTYSLKGFYYSLRAGAVIVSSGMIDVNRRIPYDSHTKIIQLWHGSPLKKIIHDDPTIHSILEKNWVRLAVSHIGTKIFPFIREHYDLVIATSDLTRRRLSSALETPLSRVAITGYPRDDILMSAHSFSNILCNLREVYKFKYLILYLPTYRGEAHSASNIFNLLNEKYPFDVDKFDRFLTQLKGLFLIRIHPLSRITDQNLIDKINKSKCIKIMEESIEEGDVYPILKDTDVLIADYSSVYCDFLLLNRPVVFASFDLKEYIERDKGFYDDYEEIAAGPVAKNWDEVLMYTKEAINQPEKYKEKRERVCKMFNKYKDANSSERVYKAIMKRTLG